MKHLLVLLLALPLSGCFISRATDNVPLDPAAVQSLTPGQSTAADVLRVLGAPTEVVQLGRRSAYRFDATTRKRAGLFALLIGLANTDTRSDRVWAFFDDADVLTHVGATFEAADTAYAMPWVDIHEQE